MFFLLWLHLFILSAVTSPLIYSSILGTYRPGEFIFHCSIFLPFHAVHGVLKTRILKWFVVLQWTVLSELSIMNCLSWVALYGMAHSFIVRQGCGPRDQFDSFSVIVVSILSALWQIKIRGLWKLPDGRD